MNKLALLIIISILLVGCDPQFLLDQHIMAVQYYYQPNCFLLIGKIPVGADSLWRSPYCSRSSENIAVYSININDPINQLSQFGIPIDSVFTVINNDTAYTVNRLYARMPNGPVREQGCNYYFRIFIDKDMKYPAYQPTRFIDLFVVNGIIKKAIIHFWAT